MTKASQENADEWQLEFDLINDLLSFQELEPGEFLTLSSIDLHRWLPQSISPFMMQAAQNSQRLSFEPFYRGASRERRQNSGTGLGLAMVKRLALRLSGDISVESENGQTRFTVSLALTQ